MATKEAPTVTTEYGSLPKWASWLGALVGLWVVVSPFVLSGSIADGTPLWSNAVAGIVVLILAAFAAYTIRTAAEAATNSAGEWSGWIAALAGLWILVSPFVLSGTIGSGAVMWSNVIGGGIAFILAGYAGYHLHSGE